MTAFDTFASQLFEEAKRFLEKESETLDPSAKAAFLHAALLLGFSALEALVSAVADDFLSAGKLDLAERCLLAERELQLKDGQLTVSRALRMTRLQDRYEFLVRRYSGKPVDKTQPWWSQLKEGLDRRNDLTHPKTGQELSRDDVHRSLSAVVEALSALYLSVYKTRFPAASRGISSNLTF